jgi:hypothetical protein
MANQDGHDDVSAPEYNAQGMGPQVEEPEPPSAATHGCPISEKETQHLPIEQPVQPRLETDLQQEEKANQGNPPAPTAPETPQNALKHSLQQTSVQVPPPPYPRRNGAGRNSKNWPVSGRHGGDAKNTPKNSVPETNNP